jgi:hypothetical protein
MLFYLVGWFCTVFFDVFVNRYWSLVSVMMEYTSVMGIQRNVKLVQGVVVFDRISKVLGCPGVMSILSHKLAI